MQAQRVIALQTGSSPPGDIFKRRHTTHLSLVYPPAYTPIDIMASTQDSIDKVSCSVCSRALEPTQCCYVDPNQEFTGYTLYFCSQAAAHHFQESWQVFPFDVKEQGIPPGCCLTDEGRKGKSTFPLALGLSPLRCPPSSVERFDPQVQV